MNTLFRLFGRSGGLLVFGLLEVVCFFLIVNYNTRQGSIFTHTIGLAGGNLLYTRQRVTQFWGLSARADSLMRENARLREQIYGSQYAALPRWDTAYFLRVDSLKGVLRRPEFSVIPAEVISNSVSNNNNWIILNRGAEDGVTPNCGIIARDGVVGIVRHVGPKFSMAMSVLHRQVKISAALQKNNYLGSLIWEGGNPRMMTLQDVPKDVEISPGDSVMTSGYSLMFPKDQFIGRVEEVRLPKGSNAYLLTVRLSHNLASTKDVFVVKNIFHAAIDSLQQRVNREDE